VAKSNFGSEPKACVESAFLKVHTTPNELEWGRFYHYLPTISSTEIGPKYRESNESPRLSPHTKLSIRNRDISIQGWFKYVLAKKSCPISGLKTQVFFIIYSNFDRLCHFHMLSPGSPLTTLFMSCFFPLNFQHRAARSY